MEKGVNQHTYKLRALALMKIGSITESMFTKNLKKLDCDMNLAGIISKIFHPWPSFQEVSVCEHCFNEKGTGLIPQVRDEHITDENFIHNIIMTEKGYCAKCQFQNVVKFEFKEIGKYFFKLIIKGFKGDISK